MTAPSIQENFNTARETKRAADAARDALTSVMLQAMRTLLPPDTVIDLNARPLPEYLLSARTMSGNDRGTRTFRIVKVTHVCADATNPELSTWMATAIPISEKTGKDMSGATHSVGADATVSLHGDMGCIMLDDFVTPNVFDRLVDLVAKNSPPPVSAPADAS